MTTMAPVATWASSLRPPAPSTICVLVGLPLTTNVPENPADTLARPRPTRSVFSLNASLYLAAYARDVAALWAKMSTRIDSAVGTNWRTSLSVTPLGKPSVGSPPGTVPRVDTP